MPDIPRDPRQLARDILAGKVRIEDLQRERQMRGGAPAGQRDGARVPAKIPLPRQAPPAPRPGPAQRAPIPLQRPMPQRPIPQRPVPQRVPAARVPARPAAPLRPPLAVTVPAQAPPVRAGQEGSPVPPARGGDTARGGGLLINDLVKSKRALRQGILMAEILGKPKSLREDF